MWEATNTLADSHRKGARIFAKPGVEHVYDHQLRSGGLAPPAAPVAASATAAETTKASATAVTTTAESAGASSTAEPTGPSPLLTHAAEEFHSLLERVLVRG